MPRPRKYDMALLQAALDGLELQRQGLEKKIAAVKGMLGVGKAAPAAVKPPKKKRRLSAAARKRISEAQKRRWAAAKKGQ